MNLRKAAFIFLSSIICTTGMSRAEKPNVLFISVDDLNDWTGFNGNRQALTPNMDRLAREGVWFSQAYCQYPVCGPSRASVMSGMYFHQLQSPKLQPKDSFVASKVQSMGSDLLHDYLKKNGYKTMAVGKILHQHLPRKSLSMSGGRGSWDHNKDANGKDIESNWKTSKTLTDWAVYNDKESKMSDSKAADWAVERLGKKHTKPFMLMVGFLRPHVPWHVPQKYFDLYDPEKLELPKYLKSDLDDVPEAGRATINDGYPRTEWALENDQWRNMIHAYLASISFADAKVGQVLDALEASPYRDNTIVILWSDHGYHMGEKNTFQKHTLWERSARAPLIIKPAPVTQDFFQKGRCEKVVGLIDIYPTLLDLCELPANDKVVGRSLMPLLKNTQSDWDYPALTYRKDNGKSVRYDRYRYIEYGDGSMELYDHSKDPNEWVNLAGNPEQSEALGMMKRKFSEYHVK